MATAEHIERFQRLSHRRRQVLELLCKGLDYGQIAERLVIQRSSVRKTVHDIYIHLDLLEFSTDQRLDILWDVYCPLFAQDLPSSADEDTAELEPVSALTVLDPEVEQILDEDERALMRIQQLIPKPRRGCLRWLGGGLCLFIFLAVVAGGAILAWEYGDRFLPGLVPATASATTTLAEPEALVIQPASPTIVVSSATPQPTMADTPIPSPNPTATLRPSPTVNFGPTYEMGDWHEVGDVWFRLFEYEVTSYGIYFLVEMWNRSNQTLYFRWSTVQNTFLQDNLGIKYEVHYDFDYGEFDEIVQANSRLFITYDYYNDVTSVFERDNLFNPGVRELYFTLEYFSTLERATWRIDISE